MADFFHEMQWWEGVMFAPLARTETEVRKDFLRVLDIATTPFSARSRHDASRVTEAEILALQAERDFFAAYAAIERVRALFQPRRPDGTLWTDKYPSDSWPRGNALVKSKCRCGSYSPTVEATANVS